MVRSSSRQRGRRSRSSNPDQDEERTKRYKKSIEEPPQDSSDEEDEENNNSKPARHSTASNATSHEHEDEGMMKLSQLGPELSQAVPTARDSDHSRFFDLSDVQRDKLVQTLSRLLLFKGLAGESMDRKRCLEELYKDDTAAGNFLKSAKPAITRAAFELAAKRIRDVFGFDVVRIPQYMMKVLPARYQERYYLINPIEQEDGGHSRALHSSVSTASASHLGMKEKGLLMVVLAFAYCRGEPREASSLKGGGSAGGNTGASSSSPLRWIADADLYRMLHDLDEQIADEPPILIGGKPQAVGRDKRKRSQFSVEVDQAVETFVRMDYLLREKAHNEKQQGEEGEGWDYSMGPRAVLEIGRKQLVYFIAEVMDQQPDPTMIAEIEEAEEEDGDEEEEEGGS